MTDYNVENENSRRISILVKNHLCLYDKKNDDYYTTEVKENAYKALAKIINSEFQFNKL